MKSKRLFIYCAGGLGREIFKLARIINEVDAKWTEICFLDDSCSEKEINGADVWTFEKWREEHDDEDFAVVATGEPQLRRALTQKILDHGGKLDVLMHPDFYRSPFNTVLEGTIITEGNLFTDNITVGKSVLVNLGCSVGHRVVLQDFVTISPRVVVSGDVIIGEGTYIGTGAIIRDGVTIGKNCIIGMGSLVTKNIPDNVVAYGNPCRVVRKNDDGVVFR